MDFIQEYINKGYTRVMITNRGLKGSSPRISFEVFKYNIESVEDYNKIVESDLHANHPYGFSVGFMNPNL
jgi:hypothetical protein